MGGVRVGVRVVGGLVGFGGRGSPTLFPRRI